MPVFEVQGPDGKTYELEGPSMEWAVSAFKGLGQRPSESSNKAADMLVRYATGGAGIKHALEKAGEHAKGLMTGEIPPTPENVLPAATMGMGASPLPIKLGFRGPPGAGPNLYGARPAPVEPPPVVPPAPIGPPTAQTLGDIREAALEGLLKPTGTIPSQGKAGSIIREAIEPRTPPRVPGVDDWMLQPGGPTRPMVPGSLDEWIYQSKAGTPSEEWLRRARTPGDDWTAGLPRVERVPEAPVTIEPVPKAIRDLFPGREGDTVGHLLDLAKGENGHVALGQVMRALPEEGRSVVQGATLMRLGGGAGAKGPKGLDLVEMVKGYGEIPEASRGMLFGEAGKPGVRAHMDSVLADYNQIVGLNAKTDEAVQQPLDLVASLLKQGGYGTIGHLLLRGAFGPHHAATIAQASRAALNLLQKGRTPATIAALLIAMRNLENTIGSAEAAPRSIADQNKPLPEEEEARRRIRERAGEPQRAGETLVGAARSVAPILDKLPYEKMRQSRNVYPLSENASRRVNLPPEIKDRFLSDLVQDPMAVAAGMQDLLTPAERKLLGRR